MFLRCLISIFLFIFIGVSSTETKASSPNFQGFACNVVHDPGAEYIWSIHLYDLENSISDSTQVFGVTQNRKIQSVACTSDGSYVVFSLKENRAGDYEIYSLDVEERTINRLTSNDTDDVDVTMSAEGLHLAWQERLADGRQAIALRTYQDSDRSEFTQSVLASATSFVQPTLSANGRWLALVQLRPNNFIALRYSTLRKNFTTVKSIVRRKKLFHPSVSNDGLIYGWLENNNQGRYIVKNLYTNESQLLLQNPEGIRHPVISPDGDWVAYSYNNSNERKSLITRVQTGGTKMVGTVLTEPKRYLAMNWAGGVQSQSEVVATGVLNDTGITTCSSGITNELECPRARYPGQDGDYGRDVTEHDDTDGVAGFSFTKLDIDGSPLSSNSTMWACVKDNVTGLIWEVKHGGNYEGLHDRDDRYSWYSADIKTNGGFAGYDNRNNASCFGYKASDDSSFCNTESFVGRVNRQGLCGASDWRLPNHNELMSIQNYERLASEPMTDLAYFPGTVGGPYWSSSISPHPSYAREVDFIIGGIYVWTKGGERSVRLVRGDYAF